MRIAIVTDAWHPQRNGVVRVLTSLCDTLRHQGHQIVVIEPGLFRSIPCPSYPEIRLSLFAAAGIDRALRDFAPDAIHLPTEGPLGWAGRRWCLKQGVPFTTAYHTKFPHYVRARTGVPLAWPYALMQRFHAPSAAVMCPSPSVHRELGEWGFHNAVQWCHGVDAATFHPQAKDFIDLPRPLFLYVGRVAVEKNLPAFLELDLPGSKMVVGDGPARASLMRRFPQVHWRIANGDQELSRYFAAGDCFVFPSLTDTFGLVMLEALACGIPVAAFPVPGPQDVIGNAPIGVLSQDLRAAALAALDISPQRCRDYAGLFSWDRVAEQFLTLLHPIGKAAGKAT
ncbi:glycosyltransferase family 4 protein [Magnetospirillum sulfuroxidans]|uniref:Glycosyltransferase family 1 protein n=1 Tax=Magnetospirillum sulfuroxidans TaxID=611300 RepID=A0ABS5IA10_9PROT|nr:glycosyltransferase family 1 protein [Magnetospirillum sulfuroxidans]MBR9971263.1 glycosyltransferase family 1 protein [Magnetospirillum sulfuroxidans]